MALAGATLGGALTVTATNAAATSTPTLSAASVTTTADSIGYGDVLTTGAISLTASNGALAVGNVTSSASTAALAKTGGTGDVTINGTLSSTASTVQSDTNIYAASIQGATDGTIGIKAAGVITGVGVASTGVAVGGTGGTQLLRAGSGITIGGSDGTTGIDAQTTTGNILVNGALGATTRAGGVSLAATAGNM